MKPVYLLEQTQFGCWNIILSTGCDRTVIATFLQEKEAKDYFAKMGIDE
jgi:hypothetical protein